jgi:hypothetical protein
VYGILNVTDQGYFTLTFDLDGSTEQIDYPSTKDRKLYKANTGIRTLTHYLFHEKGSLNPGNHTLVVDVTAINQGAANTTAFMLDYLTYTPSFSYLSEKPTFVKGQLESPPQSSQMSPSISETGSSTSHPRIGLIVGPVFGGTILLLLLAFVFRLRRKVAGEETGK